MRNLFISFIILFLSASGARAATSAQFVSNETRFFLDSSDGFGNEIYYNCQDVEFGVRDFLKQMGARDIKVHCTGGFDNFSPPIAWQAFVEVSFQSLKLADSGIPAQWKAVDFWETGNCYLYSQVFDEVKDSFSIRNLEQPWRCLSSSSSFQVKLETLFEARK